MQPYDLSVVPDAFLLFMVSGTLDPVCTLMRFETQAYALHSGAFLDKRRPYQHFNLVGSDCYGRLFEGALSGRRNLDDEGDMEDEGEEDFPDDEVIRLAIQHLEQ